MTINDNVTFVQNLHARMDRMKTNLTPLFTDMTWGAGGSTADLSLDLALHLKNTGHVCKYLTMMNDDPLPCDNMC